MEHFTKARELGKAITESEEYMNLIKIEEKIAKIENESGNYSEEERKKLDSLIDEYDNAQAELRELMNDINRIISHYINLKVEKGDCSSCGKCN